MTKSQRCERICALARKLSNLSSNFSSTYSSQWLERSLDDSAIRRMDIPEMFLLTDAILITLDNVTSGLVVYPAMIRRQMDEELPFMAMEGIIMRLVHKGVSRQEAHERIRVLSLETVREMKTEGANNNLMEKIKGDEFFVSPPFSFFSSEPLRRLIESARNPSGRTLMSSWTLRSSREGQRRLSRGILRLVGQSQGNWRNTGGISIQRLLLRFMYDL